MTAGVPAPVPRPYLGAAGRAPAGVIGGPVSADFSRAGSPGEVVVFLIGMRVNRWRRPWSWLPVLRGMSRMLDELGGRPDAGLLGAVKYWTGGRDFLVVQYWRSAEHLGRYARDPGLAHAPAWAAFNRDTAATADVGIWHESYTVGPDQVESLYANLPATGLAAAGGWAPRSRRRRSAAVERMGQRDPEYVADVG